MPIFRKKVYKKHLNYTPLRIRQGKRKYGFFKFMAFLIICIGFLSFISNTGKKNSVVPSSQTDIKSPINIIEDVLHINEPTLDQVVEEKLRGHKGTFGIAVKNLKTNETYMLNEHHKFQTASLYKLWVMATVYEKIKNGQMSESETLEQDITALNKTFNIASEEAEMKEGKIRLSVDDALEQMITISHNYASFLLTVRVRASSVKSLLEEHGLLESSFGQPPRSTPFDIMLFFEKLYKGWLTDEAHTQKMLSLLKRQKLNYALPENLPEDVVIAHKTGELNTFSHDAGIVYTGKGDYIIVIMTDTKNIREARDIMADISEAVYNYFEGR